MRRAAIVPFLSLAAAGLLAGCPDRSISEVNPLQGRVEFKDIPVKVNRDIDILFLIDNSPSMADKQVNLAKNFPKFIEVLSTIQGGLPNVHIGVVTSDMGTKGAAEMTAGPPIGTLKMGGCSGLGDNGKLQVLNGAPINGPFISDILQADGTRSCNYTGPDPSLKCPVTYLTAAFAQMAQVGAGGCGFEQHLEAVKQALEPTNSANLGFLRPDAFLAIVIIADEDDCSIAHPGLLTSNEGTLGPLQSFRCTRYGVTCDDNGKTTTTMNQLGPKGKCHPNDASEYLTKVSDYVAFLKTLKADDPSKIIVAGIMGTSEPFAVELRSPPSATTKVPALAHSCTYTDGAGQPEVADPPVRMKFFLDQFPNRSTFVSVCQPDLSGGLRQIGDLLKTVIGDPCIEGKLADTDPNTAGDQFECSVSAVTNLNKPEQVETLLPACETNPPAGTPCWHLVTDAAHCSKTPQQLTLKVDNQDALSQDTHVLANCVTEITNNTTTM